MSKFNFLFACFILLTNIMYADNSIYDRLNNANRNIRKNAVKELKEQPMKKLLKIAKESIDSDNSNKKQSMVYTFHRIMAIAQSKGFSINDAIKLIDDENSTLKYKIALFDWLNEWGVKKISPEDAQKLLPKLSTYFIDKKNDIKLRMYAHSVCREFAGKVKNHLRELKKTDRDKKVQIIIANSLRTYILQICQIVSDEQEQDDAVQLFAGYLGYYRSYVKDGICEDNILKSALEAPLIQKKRNKQCKERLRKLLKQWQKE